MSAVRRPVVSAVADDEVKSCSRPTDARFAMPRSRAWRAENLAPWRTAVAAVISASRRDHDFTQPQLARRIGWSRDKLAKVEAGKRRVELGDVVMIAQALGETPERFFRLILAWSR